jgi:CRP-like cAMP-binding protein
VSKGKHYFKDQAAVALSRGEWSRALQYLQIHCAEDPTDVRSRQRAAELLERLGRKEAAVREYQKLASDFAEQGLLVQAIAITKIMLRIDPSLKDASRQLARLYRERFPLDRALPLPSIPLFSELTEEELRELIPRLSARSFEKDQEIVREGERGDSLMVISRGEVGIFRKEPEGPESWVRNLSEGEFFGEFGFRERGDSLMVISRGEVGIFRKEPEGPESWVRNLSEGEFFGEFGFFTDGQRHATVKSAGPCETIEISRETLRELGGKHSGIEAALSRVYEKRVLDVFVAASALFAGLSGPERENVYKRFRLLEIPQDTCVFKGGDGPGSLYLIKAGRVKILIEKPGGGEITLATLESGDFFGEIGPLFDTPRMASARTLQPCHLFELSKTDFDFCLARVPQIRSNIAEVSRERLTAAHAEILSHKKTEQVRNGLV